MFLTLLSGGAVVAPPIPPVETPVVATPIGGVGGGGGRAGRKPYTEPHDAEAAARQEAEEIEMATIAVFVIGMFE